MEYHIPVMLDECIKALAVKNDGIYFDGTLGGGGHTEAILKSGGKVVATDKDSEAIAFCTERLKSFGDKFVPVKSDFKSVKKVLSTLQIENLDGAILDLGISSHQVDAAYRGFSYRYDAKLDMRMDETAALSAYDAVNTYGQQQLANVLWEYGEEKFSRRIAANIVEARKVKPIETTLELVEIIKKSVPQSYMRQGHPAKKTFQALRIEVNGELDGLKEAVEDLVDLLKPGAKMCVITFHSLEDRIIKNAFKLMSTGCVCDKSLPVCVCGHKATIKLTAKIKPSKQELDKNQRSASATLRVIEKL